MQHRLPSLFWLLLAATLCVDAVVLTWLSATRLAESTYASVTFHALTLGQLGVVSICCAMNPAPTPSTWLFPAIAATVAALATVLFTPPLPAQFPNNNVFVSCIGYFGLYVALVVASLWLLKRSRFWRKRTGVDRAFQYRVIHVLVLMTACGILAALLRNNWLFLSTVWWQNAIFAFNFIALAVASVIIHSIRSHWILRCALVTGVAMLVGVVAIAAVFGLAPLWSGELDVTMLSLFGSYYLIQALVLWIWLTVGQIVPELSRSDAADTATANLSTS